MSLIKVSHPLPQVTPIFETTSEPMSNFLVLRSNPDTPLVESNIRPVYTPGRQRAMPVSQLLRYVYLR